MKYVRTFHIQAAHLNSEEAYRVAWIAAEGSSVMNAKDLMVALRACHGHNFRIEVEVESAWVSEQGWLIDDVALSNVVATWDNTNLSIHDDFLQHKIRATTENMAMVLFAKLDRAFPEKIRKVTVWENDDIYAEAP